MVSHPSHTNLVVNDGSCSLWFLLLLLAPPPISTAIRSPRRYINFNRQSTGAQFLSCDCVVRMLDIAPDRRRPRARRQLRLRPNPSWDEQQLARSLAALHVGMGPGRIRQRIFATNTDSELPSRDPVKQLRRAGAQQFRRMGNRRTPTLTRGSFRHRRRLLLRS